MRYLSKSKLFIGGKASLCRLIGSSDAILSTVKVGAYEIMSSLLTDGFLTMWTAKQAVRDCCMFPGRISGRTATSAPHAITARLDSRREPERYQRIVHTIFPHNSVQYLSIVQNYSQETSSHAIQLERPARCPIPSPKQGTGYKGASQSSVMSLC